jgi:hypothetical protein
MVEMNLGYSVQVVLQQEVYLAWDILKILSYGCMESAYMLRVIDPKTLILDSDGLNLLTVCILQIVNIAFNP